MTLPFERTRAIFQTRQFLINVAYNQKRIPKEIKELAKSCLRHFPNEFDLKQISEKCPEVINFDIKQ